MWLGARCRLFNTRNSRLIASVAPVLTFLPEGGSVMNRSSLVAPLFAVMTFVACGRQSSFKLQLAGSSQLSTDGDRSVVSMPSGDTLLLAVVVVGTAPAEVKLTTTDLPAFVKLDGPMLRVTPTRTEAGEYTFTVTATAGHESAS